MRENHAPAGVVTCNDSIIPPSTYKGSFSRIKGVHSVKDSCSLRFIHLIEVLSADCSLFFPFFLTNCIRYSFRWTGRTVIREITLLLGNPKIARYIAQSLVTRPHFTPSYAFSRYFFLFVFIILSLSSKCLLPLFIYSSLRLPFPVFHPPSLFVFLFLTRLVFISSCIFLFRRFRVLSENAY